ncbi:unnamed protein product [Closterium sp. NIES-54]
MAGPEERVGRGAGGSGEAQAQGQPRDSAMAPVQPSLGPPRDEPRVFGLDKFNGDNFAEWSFRMENVFDHYDLLEVMEGTEKRPENDTEKSPWVRKSAQGYLLLGQALGSSQICHIKPFQREPEKRPKQSSAEGMAVEGAEDEGKADLAATTSMEATGVADTAATTRATNAVADGSTASVTIVTRADICGTIASSSLMDGPLLKAKGERRQRRKLQTHGQQERRALWLPEAHLRTTGVTGSAAKTSGKSNGPTGDWRSGITGLPEAHLRTTGTASNTTATSTQPPSTAAPPIHTPPAAPLSSLTVHPLVPLLWLPHIHPPQR